MAIPTFSIILPTYNRETLLAEAIQSVLNQDYSDFELLIIDDGSEDDTATVVSGFNDDRIVYHFQKNKGKGSSRNAGISKSRGNHICFLDDDDLYHPNHLSEFYKSIIENPDSDRILRTGVISTINGTLFESKFFEGKGISDQIEFILSRYFCLLDLCIPSKIAKSVQFPDYRLWQDKYYIILLLSQYPLKQIRTRTVTAREHEDRSVNNAFKDPDIIKEQILALRNIQREIDHSILSNNKIFSKTEAQILSTHIYHALQYGSVREGIHLSMSFIRDKALNISIIQIIKTWFRYYF